VTSPTDLAVHHTSLTGESFAYLQRLMASWGVLSDLSFSDFVLLVPVREDPKKLVVLGQIRPTTGSTLIRVDLVGEIVDAEDWYGIEEAIRTGEVFHGTITISRIVPHFPNLSGTTSPTETQEPTFASAAPLGGDAGPGAGRYPSSTGEVPAIEERAQLECLPVPWLGSVIAVLVRVGPLAERRTGRLERVYRDLYRRLGAMVVSGDFPFSGEEVASEDAPRVGDGLLVTELEGRVTYSSPNAMSALHRMGVNEAIEGRRLSDVGVDDSAIQSAIATGKPVIEEVERRPDVIVLVHCTPLVDKGAVTGSMVLLRDVTDLRRLDRMLLSKDAAIREVHHRVKNNLQTISSLLRLQARRLDPGEGRDALREAERRVRSIAVVHEILSRDPGEQVSFDEIVVALVRMTEDSVVSGRRVHITVNGDAGDLSADIATPLAVALAELLQNAVEHAFEDSQALAVGDGSADRTAPAEGSWENDDHPPGNVWVHLSNEGDRLDLQVRDDGRGLPAGFEIDDTTSLGLSIVRDLVRSQLGGAISMHSEDGTVVTVTVPLDRAPTGQ
jgi:two-component sensor histidine kinase